MPATQVLIQLFGLVALLLWGIHMVQSGIERAYGSGLRRFLGRGMRNRLHALLAGLGVTALLQSSTATAMMVTSFTAGGLIALTPALAAMLGANIGTTLIVQLLSFDITAAYPVLILAGVVCFRRGAKARTRDLGRVAIGLGLILLSLQLLAQGLAPVEESAITRALFAALTQDPLLTVLVTALVAWLAHASVAAMLLVLTLAGHGVLPAETIVAMVLGANLGTAVNPLTAAIGQDRKALRVPVANLLNRLAGIALALPFLQPLAAFLERLAPDPTRLAVDFHTAFNVATALVFLLILPLVARLVERLFPDRPDRADPKAPRYLDEAALARPAVALSNAAREVLRMADVVDAMLRGCREVISGDDRARVAEIRAMDDVLDALHRAVHRYVGRLDRNSLSEEEAARADEIIAFAINLEHAGDIVDNNLMELAAKRIRHRLSLSPEGRAEIDEMLVRLAEHMKLAVAVFMFGDQDAARSLVAGKDKFRDLERRTTRAHLARVSENRPESVETTGLHLDLVRDLKRVEAHIATTAYPLLEEAGELRPSRLAG